MPIRAGDCGSRHRAPATFSRSERVSDLCVGEDYLLPLPWREAPSDFGGRDEYEAGLLEVV